jgi:predicted O-linked N-acetylglucosamine transferase (SPINDLY family)
MLTCDWSTFSNSIEICINEVKNSKKIIHPFSLLGLVDDVKLHTKCSKIYVKDKYDLKSNLGPIIKNYNKKKIRIGYYSACFHNHAISHLIAELLETHDKKKFEIYGFSFGLNLNDQYRQRLSKSFDCFYIVNYLSDREVALLSRKIGIDIAIDLNGYTSDCRPNIFSYRCAPIQVNYLGYPGSMGVSYMDYIIADKTVIPKNINNLYSEKIIYLPNSYQPNDTKRKISNKIFTKKELNLPENSFIFCCFNNAYKILPEVFNIWMEILKNVENSVIWLLEDSENSIVSKNLKKEARARGVSDHRLIFSQKVTIDEHLARLKLADLFLDTFPYNAHTTCTDALWAGVPVLTYSGKSFASRVAASLLNTLGLEELVTDSLDKYKTIAIKLSKNKNELFLIREKLLNSKIISPLFNTSLFAKNLEKSYKIIYSRYLKNLELQNIEIN